MHPFVAVVDGGYDKVAQRKFPLASTRIRYPEMHLQTGATTAELELERVWMHLWDPLSPVRYVVRDCESSIGNN